jgi:hypothetical protein
MGLSMSEPAKESKDFGLDFFRAHHGRLYEGRHEGKLKQMYLAGWDRGTRAVTMASHSPDPYHEFPVTEVEDLVLLPKDSTDFVYENSRRFIQATVGGIEGIFYAAEHFNYGRGWMMLERDGRIQGVVPCSSLKNPVALEERKTGAGSGKTTTYSRLVVREALPQDQIFSLEEPIEYRMPWTTQFLFRGEFRDQDDAINALKG